MAPLTNFIAPFTVKLPSVVISVPTFVAAKAAGMIELHCESTTKKTRSLDSFVLIFSIIFF